MLILILIGYWHVPLPPTPLKLRNLTWNPNMTVWKMMFLFKRLFFRFHVFFWGGGYTLFLFWKVWWWCLQRWWSANTVVVLAASLGTRGFSVEVETKSMELLKGDVDKEISRLLNYKIYQNTYFWDNTCICSLDVYIYIYDIISNIDNNAILYIYLCISLEHPLQLSMC